MDCRKELTVERERLIVIYSNTVILAELIAQKDSYWTTFSVCRMTASMYDDTSFSFNDVRFYE